MGRNAFVIEENLIKKRRERACNRTGEMGADREKIKIEWNEEREHGTDTERDRERERERERQRK